MIKIQIDLADASAAELVAFYEIPGMKDAICALNTRGPELNVALSMTGAEGAVASLMSAITTKLPPHIEVDEYHTIGSPNRNAVGSKLYFTAGDDGVQNVVIGPSGEAKSMLGQLRRAERSTDPDLSGY